MTGIVLYGFDGSTYVRTVRMLLAEKGAHYEQVPVNVLNGEPRQPEHIARHPFGKVPVLDQMDSASSKRALSRHMWTRCYQARRSHPKIQRIGRACARRWESWIPTVIAR